MMNRDFIDTYNLIPEDSRILCAVSGGVDSMVLLHFLWSNREQWKIEVCAAHFDHQLRGLESARDRTFVRDWCRDQEIELKIGFGEVKQYAENHHFGTEEAARELRYTFLENARQELKCDWIVTAHNAEDQLETQLLNLCRGTGLRGLCGIPPKRERVLRPLLGTSRREILRYAEENQVPFVEDHTNGEDDFSRNRIRHHVLPILQGINSSAVANAGLCSELLREDEDYLQQKAREELEKSIHEDGSLKMEGLRILHPAIAGRVLRQWMDEPLDRRSVQRILYHASTTERRILEIPGCRLILDQGRLYQSAEEDFMPEDRELREGINVLPDRQCSILVEPVEIKEQIHSSFSIFYLKYDNINGTLSCTARRDGDRLRLRSRQCTKKLKSLFEESGLTKQQRQRVIVIRDERQVLAVEGFGVSEWAEARPGDRAWKISICRDHEERE